MRSSSSTGLDQPPSLEQNCVFDLRDWGMDLGASGAPVSATAERGHQLVGFDTSPGAHADPGQRGTGLLEEHRTEHGVETLKNVDDPLAFLQVGTAAVQHLLVDLAPHQLAVQLVAGGCPRQGLQLEG